MTDTNRPPWILPVIVIGQVLATSTWFAANAVIGDLQSLWGMAGGEGIVTTAVQIGFIAGTLVFAVLGIADRFHPGNVFLGCAIVGALANAVPVVAPESFALVLAGRVVTGLSLAGVYPVGMKIAAAWFDGGLGRALGYLVGALVLGTASPHLVSGLGQAWPYQWVLIVSSVAALIGGLLVWRVPEGPHLVRGGAVRFSGVLGAFRVPRFRAAVLGYFGHMWELYALWAFIPVWIAARGYEGASVSLFTFAIIATGALGCAIGGLIAQRRGSAPVAIGQLAISGACCMISPLMFFAPTWLLVPYLLVWGFTVAGDSPQFSALNAQSAPRNLVGSALTLTNSIGFAITIVALALLEWLQFRVEPQWLLVFLFPGPVVGVWFARAGLRVPRADAGDRA